MTTKGKEVEERVSFAHFFPVIGFSSTAGLSRHEFFPCQWLELLWDTFLSLGSLSVSPRSVRHFRRGADCKG